MSETIDSLLVSLGLETDVKSFKKATDAISGVKNSFLQMAAATGVGFSVKALTADLAKSTLEMNRLSKITGFTLKQIDGLRFAMRRSGLNPESANALVQKIPAWQQAAAQGELGDKAYWSGDFNPSEFIGKSNQDALEYLAGSYEKMSNDQRRTLRSGLGLGDNDDITRLLEGGGSGLKQASADYEKLYQPMDPALIDSATKFNKEMAELAVNFENLQKQIGGPLLNEINELMGKINEFAGDNKDDITKTVHSVMSGEWYTDLMEDADRRGIAFRNYLRSNDALMNKILGPMEKHADQNTTLSQIGKDAGQKNSISTALSNPNARRYLDVIANSEGTAGYMNNGYNTMFGGEQFADLSDHPRQIKEFTQTDGKTNKTSAAGRYQFTQASWDEAAAALDLKDFSPTSQDLAALYLIQRTGQLENVINGNFDNATAGLGGVWASLPSSKYAQPKHSLQAMQEFYDLQNTPPSLNPGSESSGQIVVHQTNHNTIQAGAIDADDLVRRIDQKTTTDLSQALALNKTDKF